MADRLTVMMDCTGTNNKRKTRLSPALSITFSLAILSLTTLGQAPDTVFSLHALKKMSLEDLMNLEVTSVSRHPQKLSQVPSAVQIITYEDIRNSGARTLPEALRLATNLQVAQVNSSQWAISARGFNNVLANKLLVLIDGRRVYTPLYAGVFWDVQNLVLEDIERIEVISGPGGTIWGANAVNGVINIITKNSRDTQGFFAEAATGTHMPGLGSLRYGGRITDKLTFRAYATGFKLGGTLDTNKVLSNDDWHMVQGGVRVDWQQTADNSFSIQQHVYSGLPNPDGTDTAVRARGDNIVASWRRKINDRSSFLLQFYYDHTFRDFRNGFTEGLTTFDIDWQHRNQLGRHTLTYGINLRHADHDVTNLELFGFKPEHSLLKRYAVFVQDEMSLLNNRLLITVGTKAEHNNFTGIEYQPNLRLSWTGIRNQTLWVAGSRAVRTPSRIDRDFFLALAPGINLISGNPLFHSERVLAYELGWRSQPTTAISLSVSTFYNHYNYVRSAEPGPPPLYIPITFGNGVKGHSYGAELSMRAQVNNNWSLRGGYTFFRKNLHERPSSADLNRASAESNDPAHQALLQSDLSITKNLSWCVVTRYVGKLKQPYVRGYFEADMRLAWQVNRVIELNVVGQHLLNKYHYEFIPEMPDRRRIERGIYGKIVCRL